MEKTVKNPEISVIIPVFNAEQYLDKCISSILNQTFSDWELILVNDGSKDGSGSICDRYAQEDPRVKVIHQENQGQAAARNHGIAQAGGEWLCFVDSDDMIHPQMLELLYHAVVQGKADMSMCGYVEAETIPVDFFQTYDNQFQTRMLDEQTLVDLYRNEEYPSWMVTSKLIRKNVAQSFPFTAGRFFEDNAVGCKWIYHSQKAAIISYPMYYYRVNPESVTKCRFNTKKLDFLWALEEMIAFFTEVNYPTLRKIFCLEYFYVAKSFYRLTVDELHRKDLAKKIRRDFFRMVIRQKKDLINWMISGVNRRIKQDRK